MVKNSALRYGDHVIKKRSEVETGMEFKELLLVEFNTQKASAEEERGYHAPSELDFA